MLIDKEIKKLIEGNAIALATVNVDNTPHCIAVGDVKVLNNKTLLVGDNYMNLTVKNIKKNKKVSLVAWDKNWEDNCVGYEILGDANYYTEGEWINEVKKIHQGFPAKGAIVVFVNGIKKLA